MMTRNTAVSIRPDDAGQAALDFVAGRFTYRSREEWQEEMTAGRFQLNCEQPVTGETRLAAGDRLIYLAPVLPEPPVDRCYSVVYEDSDLLVVDKPGNLPCHPSGRFFRHTLWSLLREEHGLASPSMINRLDRETSGLVLVAKHKEAARHCSRQFAGCQVHKGYLVLVEGEFSTEGVVAEGSLGPDPASVIRKKFRYYPAGEAGPAAARACSTNFLRLGSANGVSLLEAIPRTGRCHQIRATLFGLGFPVVGDKIYGVDEEFFVRFQQGRLSALDRQQLRLDRQALHAATLRFHHPVTGQELNFSSPLPAALQSLLA